MNTLSFRLTAAFVLCISSGNGKSHPNDEDPLPVSSTPLEYSDCQNPEDNQNSTRSHVCAAATSEKNLISSAEYDLRRLLLEYLRIFRERKLKSDKKEPFISKSASPHKEREIVLNLKYKRSIFGAEEEHSYMQVLTTFLTIGPEVLSSRLIGKFLFHLDESMQAALMRVCSHNKDKDAIIQILACYFLNFIHEDYRSEDIWNNTLTGILLEKYPELIQPALDRSQDLIVEFRRFYVNFLPDEEYHNKIKEMQTQIKEYQRIEEQQHMMDAEQCIIHAEKYLMDAEQYMMHTEQYIRNIYRQIEEQQRLEEENLRLSRLRGFPETV